MRDAFTAGFADALHRSPLVVMLWQVNLLFGSVFAGLGAIALAVTLDGSSYTRSLLYDLDATALFALWTHHTPTVKLLGAAAVTLLVLYLAAWVPLYGAVVASVCGNEDLGIRDALRAGAGVTALFLRIGLLAAALFVVLVGGVSLATVVGMRAARLAVSPGLYEVTALLGIAIAAVAWVFCAAVHDHARLRAFASGAGAVTSYVWALRFVLRGGRRAYPLALALAVTGLLLAAFYQVVASQIAADWMTGVVLSILWGQAMLLARALIRVWVFAAGARLQEI